MVKKPTHTLGDAPVQGEYRQKMEAIARTVDEFLNEGTTGQDRKNGFILMVFPFENHEGRCNYMSNASREDVIVLLKEQIKRFEGQPEVEGHG